MFLAVGRATVGYTDEKVYTQTEMVLSARESVRCNGRLQRWTREVGKAVPFGKRSSEDTEGWVANRPDRKLRQADLGAKTREQGCGKEQQRMSQVWKGSRGCAGRKKSRVLVVREETEREAEESETFHICSCQMSVVAASPAMIGHLVGIKKVTRLAIGGIGAGKKRRAPEAQSSIGTQWQVSIENFWSGNYHAERAASANSRLSEIGRHAYLEGEGGKTGACLAGW